MHLEIFSGWSKTVKRNTFFVVIFLAFKCMCVFWITIKFFYFMRLDSCLSSLPENAQLSKQYTPLMNNELGAYLSISREITSLTLQMKANSANTL